jgi:hypothetical protein
VDRHDRIVVVSTEIGGTDVGGFWGGVAVGVLGVWAFHHFGKALPGGKAG